MNSTRPRISNRVDEVLIKLEGAVISNPLRRMAEPVDFEIRRGEHIALIGLNGSGKSTLASLIAGGWHLREGHYENNLSSEGYRSIRSISFNGAYGTSETPYYLQQRWQSFEREQSPTAGELLDKAARNESGVIRPEYRDELYNILGIPDLQDKPVIALSSGELRRFHLCKALLDQPQILILESPFMGLDPETRELLCSLLEQTASSLGISHILTATTLNDLPPVISHVYFLEGRKVSRKYRREEAAEAPEATRLMAGMHKLMDGIIIPTRKDASYTQDYENVATLRNIHISYGDKVLFQSLDWQVRKGEAWRIYGRNGSGKSTLLSLICADNPRAYSLDISLFDRKRGSGESIWDIKKRIGYLSSEMHSSVSAGCSAIEMVASGLKDTFGSIGKVPEDKKSMCIAWMTAFGAEKLAERNYMSLSSGEQRLVLLVRAFVKDPDLLILDEPFQGLDAKAIDRAKRIIEEFCSRPGKTLLFVTHFNDNLPSVISHTLDLQKAGS